MGVVAVTGWQCPGCGDDAVCSRQEWVAVYNYRAQTRERARHLADGLTGYGMVIRSHEDAAAACRRWADTGVGTAEYMCANCVTPFPRQQVPA